MASDADVPMRAVIPVAGEGTRLRSMAGDLPKSLVDVGGRPLLDWLLDAIAPPVEEVCLVVAPDEGASFRRRYGARWKGLRVRYALQPRPRGVADAVARARPFVPGPFVAVMGDAFYGRPLGPALDAWRASTASGGVLVEAVTDPPDDPIGLVWVEDGTVLRVEKAPWRGQTPHRVAGAFCFPEEVFEVLDGLEEAGSTGEAELEEAVTRLLDRGHSFRALEYEGWRRNVNRPSDLRRVRERLEAAEP